MKFLIKTLKHLIVWAWRLPLSEYKRAGYRLLKALQDGKVALFFNALRRTHTRRSAGYAGLVLVVRIMQRHRLLIEILDAALEKFPDNMDFNKTKIETLYRIGAVREARQMMEKKAVCFQNDPSWALMEAGVWRREYDYCSAQRVLDAAADSHPGYSEISLLQADNYWRSGNSGKAREILEASLSQLDFGKSQLLATFTIPYIQLLLADGEMEKLRDFFEKAVAAKVRNREIVFGYFHLLLSEGDYQGAATFLERIIGKGAGNLSFHQYALSLFYLEKARNILLLVRKGKPLSEGNGHFFRFLEKMGEQLKKHPEFGKRGEIVLKMFGHINLLSQKFPVLLNTAVSPRENCRIAHLIVSRIKDKTPFSMVRLGDGEGHFLPYENQLESFQDKDRASSQKVWWGEVKITRKDWEKLEGQYWSVIRNADLLGIPCPWRCARNFSNMPPGNSILDPEARGVQAVLRFLLSSKPRNENQILTSCHVHNDLESFELWDPILQAMGKCSVISCHPSLPEVLREKHGVHVRAFHLVPSEHKYSSQFCHAQTEEAPHFPDRFDAILTGLTVAYPGEVFIVAAGFLGKFYCQNIKEKGGIALDVGSTADYWLNYATRSWMKFPLPVDLKNSIQHGFASKSASLGQAHDSFYSIHPAQGVGCDVGI